MVRKSGLSLFLTFIAVMIFAADFASAQQLQISGYVKDETGEALIGAGVVTADGKSGTVTDVNGHYTIVVGEADKILRFSSISRTSFIFNSGFLLCNNSLIASLPKITDPAKKTAVNKAFSSC